MIKTPIQDILTECQNLSKQQKQHYLNQSVDFWVPNTAFPTKDIYAVEWGYDTWNDLIEGDKINEIFESVLRSDLNLDGNLTENQIKDWLL